MFMSLLKRVTATPPEGAGLVSVTVMVALPPLATYAGAANVLRVGAASAWTVTEQLFELVMLFASLTVIDSVAFDTGDSVIVDCVPLAAPDQAYVYGGTPPLA